MGLRKKSLHSTGKRVKCWSRQSVVWGCGGGAGGSPFSGSARAPVVCRAKVTGLDGGSSDGAEASSGESGAAAGLALRALD